MDQELPDTDLVRLTRDGGTEAFAALFERHRGVAQRVARGLVDASEVDDVVAEAFAATLGQLRRGRGPVMSFRAYVLTAVRHEATRRRCRLRRFVPTDDIESWAAEGQTAEAASDGSLASACRALPPRWRYVLWQLEVEGRTPRELAPIMQLSPNAVSALACRARAGLRAELTGHRHAA